jgi:predicted nicotinamide N-methyase
VSLAYETKLVHERFGALPLALETLADLDAAVEALLARTSARPDELERDLCPYFGVIWPAARALAEELARRGPALAGRSVLELGCGLALPALVAAKCGARVTATDLHPDVPQFLARNLAHNGLAPAALEYLELDWRTGTLARSFELVVGSDILYEAGHPAPVARALARHVAPGGRILLADPARAYLQACLDELRGLGFEAREEVVDVADPSLDRAGDRRTREVFLIELGRG